MALLYNARLVPSKIELLTGWLPAQPWWPAGAGVAGAAGAFRFDDPAGEVGVETHLVRTDDERIVQVPTTYRSEPLAGADYALIGTMQHSVLGQRWVYDGALDPVYVATLATAILTGGTQAEVEYTPDDDRDHPPITTRVVGSGRPGTSAPSIGSLTVAGDQRATTIRADGLSLVLRRILDATPAPVAAPTLSGTWPGHNEPVVFAHISTHEA